MNVVLLGPRACGKTTVGRLLAARLNQPFIDLDERTLSLFPEASIREVWEARGEDAWRMAERAAFSDSINDDEQVIALGGGTVMIPAVEKSLKEARRAGRIRTVYLKCTAHSIIERLRKNPGDRPSLTKLPLEEEVRSVLKSREPTYLAMADILIDADADDPVEVTTALEGKLGTPASGR